MSYENSKHSGAAAKQTVPQDSAEGMKSSERKSTIPMRTAALPLTSVSGPSKAPNKQPRAIVTVVLVCVTVEVMVVVDEMEVVDVVKVSVWVVVEVMVVDETVTLVVVDVVVVAVVVVAVVVVVIVVVAHRFETV